ncbi:hypothetical protein [Streptomyces sp. NPDC060001]|uniref:hypothetical protein n=1 Tax=Streptomyces sp. NPDC060001 TaxID=3347032 RepID=UPI0036B5DCED
MAGGRWPVAWRSAGRIPRPVKALVAVEDSVITAIEHVLTDNVTYQELGSLNPALEIKTVSGGDRLGMEFRRAGPCPSRHAATGGG